MKYEGLKDFGEEDFRRLTGVKKDTFRKMISILNEAELKKKAARDKPNRLLMEDRLLMTLEYVREYRTYFHIAASYGLSESSCYRNIRWIEDILVKNPLFALPGRKALIKSDMDYEIILIDASESPIQRPKQDKKTFHQARRRDIL